MGARFLNERLLTTPTFGSDNAPGHSPEEEEPERKEEAAPAGQLPDSENAPAPDVYARREEKAVHRAAVEEERRELNRRRKELLVELKASTRDLEAERARLTAQVEAIAEARQQLQGLSPLGPNPATRELRTAKQTVQQAHLQLVKEARRESAPPSDPRVPINDLGFADLTRIGFAFSWPVIAAMILTALLIAGALLKVFTL